MLLSLPWAILIKVLSVTTDTTGRTDGSEFEAVVCYLEGTFTQSGSATKLTLQSSAGAVVAGSGWVGGGGEGEAMEGRRVTTDWGGASGELRLNCVSETQNMQA